MGYASHVGRVGALAVALGLGAAVVGVGTARADDTADGTTDSASGQDDAAGQTGTVATVNATGDTLADPRAAKSSSPRLNLPDLSLPRVVVRSSGGALPGARQSDAATPAPKPDSTPAAVDFGQPPTSEPAEGAPVELPAARVSQYTPAGLRPQRSDPPALGSTTSVATAVSSVQNRRPLSQISSVPSTRVQAGVDDTRAAIAATSDTLTAPVRNVSTSAPSGGINVSGLQLADTSTLTRQPAPQTTAAPSADRVTQVMSSLLAVIGLNPNAADSPVPAPSPTTLLGFLELIRREIERTFFNQSPTLAYDPSENTVLADGRIVGDLHPTDPDSATLTYTATDPAHGRVVVNPDGTFTYTPDAGHTGPDTFDVTVSDAASGFHIHGLPGLINLVTFGLLGESGHTYTEHVTVGFERTVLVSGLNQPVDFLFLPDGRILIAEKEGAIRLYKNGQLQNQPLVVLPVSSGGERGVEGFAAHPNFGTNGFLYVAYTSATNFDRLSRITVTGDTASLASEVVLVESDQEANDNHHGGAVAFGQDGKLYWGVGDNSIRSNSQNLSNIHGKILRINPNGTVPADNPFITTAGAKPEIYAFGFRNPYRFTSTPDGKLLVADVGSVSWEELNLVTRGANYGWPDAEGVCAGCSSVNPIYTYPRGTGAAITSVLVYTGSQFGPSFQNRVFIADVVQGWIKVLTCNSDYSSCGSESMFDSEAGTTVKLAQGPDGNIYQLTHSPGVLSRIAPS